MTVLRWKEMNGEASREFYYPTLDGWRALAILAVLVSHSTGFLFPSSHELNSWQQFAKSVFLLGNSGVDLFFAISGFLICSKILEREEQKGRIDLKQFYTRRIFRIFPLYYSYLLFLFLFVQLDWLNVPRDQIQSSALFLQNYLIPAGTWHYSLAHFWTLAVEEHFYLLFPLFLFFLPKSFFVRCLSLGFLIIAITVWKYFEFRNHFLASYLPSPSFFTRTDIRMDALLFGCLAAIGYRDPKFQALFFRLLAFPLLPWIFLGIFFFVQVVDVPFSLSFRNITATLLVLCTVLHSSQHQWLESRVLRRIGQMSFSLYVWNSFFLWPTDLEPSKVFGFLQSPPLNFVALFGLAYLSHHYLERPFQRLGRRFFP